MAGSAGGVFEKPRMQPITGSGSGTGKGQGAIKTPDVAVAPPLPTAPPGAGATPVAAEDTAMADFVASAPVASNNLPQTLTPGVVSTSSNPFLAKTPTPRVATGGTSKGGGVARDGYDTSSSDARLGSGGQTKGGGAVEARPAVMPAQIGGPETATVQPAAAAAPAAATPAAAAPAAGGAVPTVGGGKGGGKGGARTAPAAPAAPTQGQYAPVAPQQQQQGFNVNRAASAALQQSMIGTQGGLGFGALPTTAVGYTPTQQQLQGLQLAYGYTPAQQQLQGLQTGFSYDPAQRQGYTLAGRDIAQYESPYQQAVIDRTLDDLSGAQEKALNVLGQQATAARAFGGSRQGIAEAETRKGFAEKAAEAVANLRERGFQQAMGAAQFDVGQLAGTEAANVAAQQAAQQYGATSLQTAQAANIQRAQQVAAANAAAQTAAAQYGAGAQTAAEAANIQRAQQVAAANAAAQTAASQFGATAAQQAQQQNFANALSALQARQSAAQQLAGLGQQAFGIGQTIQQQQAQQGLLQQGMQQALIDAARGQYQGYVGSPQQALQAPLAALGVVPTGGTTTTSQSNPGLFSYLQTAAMLPGNPFGFNI